MHARLRAAGHDLDLVLPLEDPGEAHVRLLAHPAGRDTGRSAEEQRRARPSRSIDRDELAALAGRTQERAAVRSRIREHQQLRARIVPLLVQAQALALAGARVDQVPASLV